MFSPSERMSLTRHCKLKAKDEIRARCTLEDSKKVKAHTPVGWKDELGEGEDDMLINIIKLRIFYLNPNLNPISEPKTMN